MLYSLQYNIVHQLLYECMTFCCTSRNIRWAIPCHKTSSKRLCTAITAVIQLIHRNKDEFFCSLLYH